MNALSGGVAQVLIIEDDVAASRLLRKQLEKGGHDVVVAASGEVALHILGLPTTTSSTTPVTVPPLPASFSTQLVVCDLGLPGMSGVAVIEAVRADERTARLPVVVVSGRASMQDHALALEAGADHYLEKPLKLKAFDDAVASLLAEKGR